MCLSLHDIIDKIHTYTLTYIYIHITYIPTYLYTLIYYITYVHT